MVFSGLFIHQAHGLTEMHFHVFCALAFLLAYRSWPVIVAGAATIAVHHVAFAVLQFVGAPIFIFQSAVPPVLLTLVHAGFVVFECAVLIPIAVNGRREWKQAEELSDVSAAIQIEDRETLRVETGGPQTLAQSLLGGLSRRVKLAADGCNTARRSMRNLVAGANSQANQAETVGVAMDRTSDLARWRPRFSNRRPRRRQGRSTSAEIRSEPQTRSWPKWTQSPGP
jgi:methyl-accepting chemotaxis protein